MWPLLIAAGVLLLLASLYLILNGIFFVRLFGRGTDPSLVDVDLSATHYAPYVDRLRDAFSWFDAQEKTRVSITVKDGTPLVADHYQSGGDKLAILFHGYRATNLNNFPVLGRDLLQAGYDLLIPVSRGHEGSGGKYISFGELEQGDMLAWIDYAKENLSYRAAIAVGVSMGCHALGLIAPRIPEDARVRAMILDCGYATTIGEFRALFVTRGKRHPNFFLPAIGLYAKLFGGFDIRKGDTRKALRETKIPAFFLHASGDQVVPVRDTEENYAACASDKDVFIVEGGGHAITYMAGGEVLRSRLFAFLERFTENAERS